MKILTQLDKKIYFLLIYILFMTAWITEELISYNTNFNFLRSSQKLFSYMEIFMAILSVCGVVYFFRLIQESKNDIDIAKTVIGNLKNQNRQLSSVNSGFWNSIQDQMKKWSLTENEKEIAIFILRGLSNLQIAAIRNKSLKTIENQTFSIYQKSGTQGKLEFIAYFISPLLPDED
jgi:DNA-binding CsgD family transcriptional regulator